MLNDFNECLAFSHAAEDLPFWKEIYTKFFPGTITIISHRKDGEHQRAGIDRSIVLENSKQIFIDEKVRGRNKITGQIYTDIALEFISVDNGVKHTAGWVCKPLRADFIAYAIAPIGKCYLFPVIQLQQAWQLNKDNWIKNFGKKSALNYGYKTWFCPVPPNEIFKQIGSRFRIDFEPFYFEE